jgi:hypothetical protein
MGSWGLLWVLRVFEGEDLETEWGLEHEVELGHLVHGGGEGGAGAGLGGDDEGQAVAGVAAVLKDGVDVDGGVAEDAGDGGDDAGAVGDDEAEIVGGEEVSGYGERLRGEADGGAALGDGEDVGHDGDGGGMAAGSVAGEDDVATELAAGDDHVLGAVGPGDGRGFGDEHGADAGEDLRRSVGGIRFGFDLGAGDLADGAAEFFGVGVVERGDVRDGLGGDVVGVELGVEGEAGEDAELGAGVKAVDVGGGIGFCVAEGLGCLQDFGVVGSGFHGGEDEVAGAVDDAGDAGDAVAAETLGHAGDDGDATGDGCAVEELHVVLCGEGEESGAAIGDELLVSGDDVFAGSEGRAQPAFDGVEAAHELDDEVDVGGEENVFDAVGPDGVGEDEAGAFVGALAGDVAIEDVGDAEAGVGGGCEDFGEGGADGAEAEEADAEGGAWHE